MMFPVSKPVQELTSDEALFNAAGTNLITKTPEIANWLANGFIDRQLVIGAYAYLNGELFVRVSIAMDAIIQSVISKLKAAKKPLPTIAYLCTPTNAHLVTASAYSTAS